MHHGHPKFREFIHGGRLVVIARSSLQGVVAAQHVMQTSVVAQKLWEMCESWSFCCGVGCGRSCNYVRDLHVWIVLLSLAGRFLVCSLFGLPGKRIVEKLRLFGNAQEHAHVSSAVVSNLWRCGCREQVIEQFSWPCRGQFGEDDGRCQFVQRTTADCAVFRFSSGLLSPGCTFQEWLD